MSLISMQWEKMCNTTGKIPADWELRFINDWFTDYSNMVGYFSPQAISFRIKDTYLFPVRRKYKKYRRLKISTSRYFNLGDNLFI